MVSREGKKSSVDVAKALAAAAVVTVVTVEALLHLKEDKEMSNTTETASGHGQDQNNGGVGSQIGVGDGRQSLNESCVQKIKRKREARGFTVENDINRHGGQQPQRPPGVVMAVADATIGDALRGVGAAGTGGSSVSASRELLWSAASSGSTVDESREKDSLESHGASGDVGDSSSFSSFELGAERGPMEVMETKGDVACRPSKRKKREQSGEGVGLGGSSKKAAGREGIGSGILGMRRAGRRTHAIDEAGLSRTRVTSRKQSLRSQPEANTNECCEVTQRHAGGSSGAGRNAGNESPRKT